MTAHDAKSRHLVRPIIPVGPLVITQRNCEAALGLSERRFLELIIERGIPHAKLGKLRAVRADVLINALVPQGVSDQSSTARVNALATPTDEPASPETEADRVLAAIGRRRAR
jgi:hypothetical protein